MKKTITVFLAAIIAVLLYVPAFAFVPIKVKSIREDYASKLSGVMLDGDAVEASSLSEIAARPASELEIALVGNDESPHLFFDQNGMPLNTADVTVSRMRAANMEIRLDAAYGGELLKNVELGVRNAGTSASVPVIRLRFPDEYAGLDPLDFSAAIYILIGGKEQAGSGIELAGTFGNPEIEVNSGDVTVSADSAVLLAAEDIPLILIEAGSDVVVEASLREGERYLVTAVPSRDAGDISLVEENNGVESVIKLKASGFEPWQIKSVSIQSEQFLQVYNGDGELLGNTLLKLPYAEKYYLMSKPAGY